jgi:hypothetical protein
VSRPMFQPYDTQRIPLTEQVTNWEERVRHPYDRASAHPFTRCRVLLLAGQEGQTDLMLSDLLAETGDGALRGILALLRRVESEQSITLASLIPPAQTVLETTIFYEQMVVELGTALAALEPDLYAREILEYVLLDDLDHLNLFSLLSAIIEGGDARRLTGGLTSLAPGRPTSAQHLHPLDTLRRPAGLDIQSRLNSATITAAEQAKYLYYKGHATAYGDAQARRLYAEIAEVEEQHLSALESDAAPAGSALERNCLAQVAEAYNYYSAWHVEIDRRLAEIYERFYRQELEHIQVLAAALQRVEGRDLRDLVPDEIGPLLVLQPDHFYLGSLRRDQAELRPFNEALLPRMTLPPEWASYRYATRVNGESSPSRDLLAETGQP